MKMIFMVLSTICFSFTSSLVSGQTQQFQGSWIKLNTSYQFDFELILNHTGNNQFNGHFVWQVINYDAGSALSKRHYKNKLGLTAKEYVSGYYHPGKDVYFLKGYKKDDPHQIIGLDTYRLKVDKQGQLSGVTKANFSWDGRINGSDISMIMM